MADANVQNEALTREEVLEREVAELRRANHRLSGALDIVLGTLDAENVGALFARVLDKLTDTMQADGTICYLAEPDGFHLRGISQGLSSERVAQYMAYGRAIETLVTRVGHGMRLRVQRPLGDDLRQGRMSEREVVDEATGEVHRVPYALLPPFESFIAVPVWFGGHVISIFEVGWRVRRALREDDANLLDSVAQYLSIQLMAAFAQMRQQRENRLRTLSSEVREQLFAAAPGEGNGALESLDTVCAYVADELGCSYLLLDENHASRCFVGALPGQGTTELPFSAEDLLEGASDEESHVLRVSPSHGIGTWLDEHDEPCVGALVLFGRVAGDMRAALFVRPFDAEPFDATEMAFLSRFADDVFTIAQGEEERETDKRISQALQTGMRNELQEVPGIMAEASYSSATAAALVGGDFYDLIRLPNRRACIIMGDVSGKGVEAASVSAAVKTALGAYAWEGRSPAHMVRTLNEFLLGFSRIETFATLFVGIVDLAAGRLTYCSAGHPSALLLRAETGDMEWLGVQSGVVGAFSGMIYKNGVVKLAPGDALLLYTDGTTEARSPDGAFFGEDGLRETVAREYGRGFEGIVGRILAALDDFTGNRLEDDVALVALRFDEVG